MKQSIDDLCYLGSVARIGPNHVIIDDPEIIRRILAARSGYVRGPWFDSLRLDPHISNIVSERDVGKHRHIRAKLMPSVCISGSYEVKLLLTI